eukprot:9777108-Prorocentrum_lima.AAC.1
MIVPPIKWHVNTLALVAKQLWITKARRLGIRQDKKAFLQLMTYKVDTAAAEGETAVVYQLAKFSSKPPVNVIPSLCNDDGLSCSHIATCN